MLPGSSHPPSIANWQRDAGPKRTNSWLPAQVLVSPVMRRELAHSWEHLLVQARRPPVMRDSRAPFNRRAIIECECEIQVMLKALLMPLPVPARGTAMASRLLREGEGPIYNRHRSGELGASLRETTAQLDASVSL